jgi:hypothetical protein
VIDTSPSAGIPQPGSNLHQAQTILRSLWAQMDQPVYAAADDPAPLRSRLAIATIDVGVANAMVNLRLPLTDTTTAIEAAIAGLTTGADSSFDTGIDTAAQHLAENSRPGAEPVLIILFHDSFFALQNEVQAAAQRALAGNARVFVIGNRVNIRPEERVGPEQTLPLVASPGDVYLDPTAQDLRRLFVSASGSDETVAARGISAFGEFIPAGMGAIIGQSAGGERISDSAVRWQIDQVRRGEQTAVQFDFRVNDIATGQLNIASRVIGLDCNGFPFAIEDASGAPSLSASVATPTLEGAQPPDPYDSGLPPDTGGRSTGGSGENFGGGGWGIGGLVLPSWLWWLLLTLIVLLLIWWLLAWLRRKSAAERRTPPPIPKPTLPTGPTPSLEAARKTTGNVIIPGAASQQEAELRAILAGMDAWQGRIPTAATGPQRPTIAARWLTRPSALEQELPLRSFGDQFLWNYNGTELSAPLPWLLDVLHERIGPNRPVLAVFTTTSSDQAALEAVIDETATEIAAWPRSRYLGSLSATGNPPRSCWVNLRAVENPDGKQLTIKPAVEM